MKLKEFKNLGSALIPGNVVFPRNTTSLISDQEDYTNTIVRGNFDCSHTEIKALKGCPRKVGRNFTCAHTNIKSLKGCPRDTEWNFYCEHTKLKSFHDIHKHISRIGRYLVFSGQIDSHILGVLRIRDLRKLITDRGENEALFDSVDIINRYLERNWNPRDRDIHACQIELIEAGLARFAQL